MTRTDGELVAASLQGDLRAMEALIARHQDAVYLEVLGYVGQETDAQDLVQETFLRAFRALPGLRDPEKAGVWLRQIARRCCLNALRGARRAAVAYERLRGARGVSASESSDSPLQETGAAALTADLLARLPAGQTRILTLLYLDELPVAAIAARLGCSPQAVKQRLYRARQQLHREALAMMKDDTRKRRLPAGFGRRVLVRLIEEGRKDLLAMRYDRARARFQEAVDAAPESPEALLALGSAYDPLAGAGPQDVEVLERAAAAAPASIPVLCALAAARWQRGPEEAYRPVFRRCMDLCDHRLAANPKDAEALKARAELLRMEGDHAGAEEALRTAAGERPADQEALYLLALSMDRQGRHDEAFPVYEQVYALNPGTFWAYGSLRQRAQDLAFRKGDARQAVALMEKVWRLTRRPHEAENLLYFYSGTGQWQKAVALFESAKDPFHHPRTFATVGIGYMEQGNLDKAQDVLAQALHLAAEPAFRAEIQFHRALILFALGKNADARSVLGEGLRLDPAARSVALTGAPASVFWRPWTMRLTQTLERLAGYDARAEPLLEGVQHLRR